MFEQPVISRDHRSATSLFFCASLAFFYLALLLTFLPPLLPPPVSVFYSSRIRDRRELAGIVNHGYWTVSIFLPFAGIAIKGIFNIRHPAIPPGWWDRFHASLSPTLCTCASACRVVITDKRGTMTFCGCSCLSVRLFMVEISLKWNFAVPLKFFDKGKERQKKTRLRR